MKSTHHPLSLRLVSHHLALALLAAPLALLLACSASSETTDSHGSGTDAAAGHDAGVDHNVPGDGSAGGSTPEPDAQAQDHYVPPTPEAGPDAPPVDPTDGAPTRQACTSSFGSGLSQSGTFGRLDGYVVAIVPYTKHSCNGDSGHMHLQVEMKGSVYDVAVNIEDTSTGTTSGSGVFFREGQMSALQTAWAEGWHTGLSFDYVNDLHVHAGNFTQIATAQLESQLESDLASVNHIAVYATAYGPDGAHLVHRQHSGQDGALVLQPLSQSPKVLTFCFANDSF